MKELSIEEKAKAYDKAIEVARTLLNTRCVEGTNGYFHRKDIEQMFPILVENEDERIRKDILSFAEGMLKNNISKTQKDKFASWVTWLEKKDEQQSALIIPKFKVGDEIKTANEEPLTITKIDDKGYWSEELFICDFDEECIWDLVSPKPIDMVDSKFKVGDWVINRTDDIIMQIVNNKDFYESVEINGKRRTDTYNYIDWEFRLWTIQDAKDGDVLANDHHILILKELDYNWGDDGTPSAVKAYCGIKPNGNFEIGKDNWCFCGTLHIHPATKEQREQLEKSMADAGYTFDFDLTLKRKS